MEWNGMEVMDALRSILSAPEGNSRWYSGFDLWLQGEVQTVKVRIIRSKVKERQSVVETWLREERISSQECHLDIESLIRVIGEVSAQEVGPEISSIEFLSPGYQDMTVQQAADEAIKLGGLCLTGKLTYVPEIVTLPHVDYVWYVRVKWRPTGLSVEVETENEAGFTESQYKKKHSTRDLETTEKKALESIVNGTLGEDRIFDLWLQGEVQTVHVKMIKDNNGYFIETWLGGEIISTRHSGTNTSDEPWVKSLVEVVWSSAFRTVGRIGSIEFLLAGYHEMPVKRVADRAMELGGLCLTGKCTYKPEIVRLPQVDYVWYVRIKWRPTWRLSVEPETENQAGFAHDQLIDIDNLGPVLEELLTETGFLWQVIHGYIREAERDLTREGGGYWHELGMDFKVSAQDNETLEELTVRLYASHPFTSWTGHRFPNGVDWEIIKTNKDYTTTVNDLSRLQSFGSRTHTDTPAQLRRSVIDGVKYALSGVTQRAAGLLQIQFQWPNYCGKEFLALFRQHQGCHIKAAEHSRKLEVTWQTDYPLQLADRLPLTAGFQKCVPKGDLADHACAMCFNPLDWLGFSEIRPTCLECGHIFCTTCIDRHVAARGGGNTCPLCKQLSTKQSQWVPHGEARLWQQRWKQLGEFTN